MDNDGCAEGIGNLINNPERQNAIVYYLKSHDFGNEGEVDKLYCLI